VTASSSTPPSAPIRRVIKSFVKRAGRVTEGQAKAYKEWGAQFLLPFEERPGHSALLNLREVFDREAPTVMEIGFGMGEATAQIAALRPEINFLCCEVHEAGVGALLKRIGEQQLPNIRIIAHDAVEVLAHKIPAASLAGVHLFFPDPWHKKKHNKRRLVQAPFVKNLMQYLQVGGYFHCATDWQPYAEQMLEVLSQEPQLRNSCAQGYSPKPDYRPLTKFENRGLRLGHGVWDLVFIKRSS
jgi:tRNA (guanine-N7-)-methyltransferase